MCQSIICVVCLLCESESRPNCKEREVIIVTPKHLFVCVWSATSCGYESRPDCEERRGKYYYHARNIFVCGAACVNVGRFDCKEREADIITPKYLCGDFLDQLLSCCIHTLILSFFFSIFSLCFLSLIHFPCSTANATFSINYLTLPSCSVISFPSLLGERIMQQSRSC